jgi:hypothetical protein
MERTPTTRVLGKGSGLKSFITMVLAVGIAGILAFSAFIHLENSFHFLHTVYTYQIVDENIGVTIAALAPSFQLVIALILLFDLHGRHLAFGCSATLFLMYLIVQSTAYFRGLKIACGCFGGSDDEPISIRSIGLVFGAMLISLIGWWLTRPMKTVVV